MVKVFETVSVMPDQISGDMVSGGTIRNFSSTGIKDQATHAVLTVEDHKLTVKNIPIEFTGDGLRVQGNLKVQGHLEIHGAIEADKIRLNEVITDNKVTMKTAVIETIEGDTVILGNVKIQGKLEADFIEGTEILTNQRHENQYLEFSGSQGEIAGSGILWKGVKTRQLIFKANPDRIWITENVDIPSDRAFMFDGTPVLTNNSLGGQIVHSNLRQVGPLSELTVNGAVNIGNHIFFNPVAQRIGIGTDQPNGLLSLFDQNNNIETIIEGGKLGTFNTKPLDLVTDNQVRINISESGNVTIGHETRDNTLTRVYGKLGVGVKNPAEQFEVSGNIKFGNRLFANGNAAPGQGTYQQGDIVWNSNPRPGAHVGWICLASGSPGVWKPFGLISE